MKKIVKALSVMLALAIVATAFAGCSQKNDQKLEYKIENNEAIITGYTDSTERTEITVPDEIDGCPVTEIADFSLFNAESLTKITIGKNVKTIGTWSMTNNQRLQEFVVDEANEYFTAVDGILFTKDMKTIVYYPNAKEIEFSKFGDPLQRDSSKDDFKEITYTIPDGVETIRSKAFYKCYYIDNIVIPDSVKVIEEKAFHRCSALTALDLPKNLEFIGKDAFAYCELIKTATIPATIKEIEDYAFFNCTGIEELNIEAPEANIKQGKKWKPTSKGKENTNVKINWAK
ncbi:MAG: leucine-rich repeat domain-containing protein [Eubacterium sp.]|nr:leucine-rich repeat domain-containing protein [Eubacterium sp.]